MEKNNRKCGFSFSLHIFLGNEAREGEIRLNRTSYGFGSNDQWEGIVEIFLSGQWGAICDYGSGSADARVVCRQLGYYIHGNQGIHAFNANIIAILLIVR